MEGRKQGDTSACFGKSPPIFVTCLFSGYAYGRKKAVTIRESVA